MKLGTCLPSDESVQMNGQFSMEKASDALAAAGIRGCLANFPVDEEEWEPYSRRLKAALSNAGVELLEYNTSFCISSASGVNRDAEVEKTVLLLELAEETGCLNIVACAANKKGIRPDAKSRSRDYHDTLRGTCELIARKAQSRGLKARLLIELVYTTVVWSPAELARLVDDIASPNLRGHMDIANALSFENIFDHSRFIRESFKVLGARICSAHLKDVRPTDSYFPGVSEALVGDGMMDISTYLGCLDKMPPGFPAIIEHMNSIKDIKRSYDRICKMATGLGLEVWR